MLPVVQFALASGRSFNEIFSLRWDDFDRLGGIACVVYYRKTWRNPKGGQRTFPLPPDAQKIISRQQRLGERIFPRLGSPTQRFIYAKKHLGIKGLRLQDFRRESIMRMFEANMSLDEVQAVTGLHLNSLQGYRAQHLAQRHAELPLNESKERHTERVIPESRHPT